MTKDLRVRDALAEVVPIGHVVTPSEIVELLREHGIKLVKATGSYIQSERLASNIWAYLNDGVKKRGEFQLMDRSQYRRLAMPRYLEHASKIARPFRPRRIEGKKTPAPRADPSALDAKRTLYLAATKMPDVHDDELEKVIVSIIAASIEERETARIVAIATKAFTCADRSAIRNKVLQKLVNGALLPELAPVVASDPSAAPIAVSTAPQTEAQPVQPIINGLSHLHKLDS